MTDPPQLTFTTVNIGAPDPSALAHFYANLLGWSIVREEPTDFMLHNPDGGVAISIQEETSYVRPVWPAVATEQQMMMHLEIMVEDLDAAAAFAVSLGATVAEVQPQDDVRVCLDPAGHPFCLWIET